MTWKQRLRDIVLAGGTVTAAACGGQNEPAPATIAFCGNANPDPCICGRPESDPGKKALCDQKIACELRGGEWWYAGPPCMCASGETDPMLMAECDQKKACEAQGGSPFWDDHPENPDAGLPPAVGCEFPDGSRLGDTEDGAGTSRDGTN